MIARLHAFALRSLIHTLSGLGARKRLSVLTFHQVLDAPDDLNPSELNTADFCAFLDFLQAHCKVLPLDAGLAAVASGTLPSGAVSLTFDDGYPEWSRSVAQALLARNMHATFFVTSGTLDGSRLWHEDIIQCVRNLKAPLVQLSPQLAGHNASLTVPQTRLQLLRGMLKHAKGMPLAERGQWIAALEDSLGSVADPSPWRFDAQSVAELDAKGFGIGAHTVCHPILNLCTADEARHEIGASREMLQAVAHQPIRYFAYPNGRPHADFGLGHVTMVQACGYDGAFTTSPGCVDHTTDPFQQPRFGPWKASANGFGRQLVRNLMAAAETTS